jgi:hypothetical protein
MTGMDELAELIARYAGADGIQSTALPRVSLIRASRPTEPLHALHHPALCLVAQGRKQVMIGPNVFLYDSTRYLIVSVDVPVTGQVLEATPKRPYLCFRLDLDPAAFRSLILESGSGRGPADGAGSEPERRHTGAARCRRAAAAPPCGATRHPGAGPAGGA